MKIGKGLATVVSILFFFELVFLFLGIFLSIFPGFSFSENPVIRLIFLVIFIAITKWFYNYLLNEPDEEGENEAIVSESSDLTRKVAVVGVLGIFIVAMGLFVFMNSTLLFGIDDVENPLSFSDSNISFKYPGNWKREYSNDIYLVLFGNGVVFNLYYNINNGNSLDELSEQFISNYNGQNTTTVLYKNTTTINGKKAYEIGLKTNGSHFDLHIANSEFIYSRMLIFEGSDNYYIYTFTANRLDNIDSGYDLIKNTTKFK